MNLIASLRRCAARSALTATAGAVLLLSGCASAPVQMAPSPEFSPVYPAAAQRAPRVTGAIYNGPQSDSWFGRGRNYQVGDLATVLLDESTQAVRQQSANVSREASNDVVNSGLSKKITGLGSLFGGINLNSAAIESSGSGQADQRARLTGSVSVTVVEVLANGNLVLRGEKQVALTEGAEVIQVSGMVRPDDISPNNTVLSRRLANAQIAYRGQGDIANASKAGWGTRLLLNVWPF